MAISTPASIIQGAYELVFSRTPIILVDGFASGVGGYLPIMALTETVPILTGQTTSFDDFFANYQVQDGASLLSYQSALYPFYNATEACNAQFKTHNVVSFLMVTPPNKAGAYLFQLPKMLAFKATLERHQKLGGTYILITPSNIYTGALLENITQTNAFGNDTAIQTGWTLNFIVPLTDKQAAQNTYNDAMDKAAQKLPASPANVGEMVTSLF